MHRTLPFFILSALLLGACAEVQAIAVDDYSVAETNPAVAGYSFNWDYTYKYKGSSSAAVDHYWILTAAHVGDDLFNSDIIIDGVTNYQQEVVFHSQSTDPDSNPTADLALVRYDKPFPGYYLLNSSVPVGSELMIVGYGYPGDVEIKMFNSYFTEDNTGSRIQRWGTNEIDGESTQDDSKGFDISISNSFGNPTDYEAGCNVFDSGSGMFYDDGGIWKLTGTMVNRSANSSGFSGNFAVATKYYVNWIKSVITDYDTDMDGLPDWWESDYGSGPTSMDAAADPDGDDFSNYTEWIADTDPTNGASHFIIFEWLAPTNVTFSSSVNRQYLIEYRLDLVDTNAAWTTEVDWFVGTTGQTETALPEPASNRAYRIRAKLNH